ncbi:MAG TPA: ABC transporter ATP-binding protein [Streptosporangiaceae bacterium]|nr:ABC transporter ATP-binding protein [Streptosporangiaceae bacterium]
MTAPAETDLPLLQVEHLRTAFTVEGAQLVAVDDVSFTLSAGRTLAIVGESGSGKTVLTRTIMQLLPRTGVQTSGRVFLTGRDMCQLDEKALRQIWGRHIALILQDPMSSLTPTLTIGSQIAESLQQHLNMSRLVARARAVDLLESVGIPAPRSALDRYPHQLSGGLRQRVCIAIAMACGPALLLADEPTTALDVTVQAQILDLLAAQQSERQMAMILITHDLAIVAGRADHTIVMYAGRIVEQGPTRRIFAAPRMPYTRGLLDCIPRLSDPSHTPLAAIPGRPPDLLRLGHGCPFAPRCARVHDRCHRDAPPLVSDGGGHWYACWYPIPDERGSANGSPEPTDRNTVS